MLTFLIVAHLFVCFFLVIIVLLQQGKGASVGASFGGSSQTLFGTEGPLPMMNKITTAAAVVFMITSLSLAYFSARVGDGSVMEVMPTPVVGVEEVAPAPDPVVIPLPQAGPGDTPGGAPGDAPRN
ncbi:MAG: preprotein translocase subunit SecG [Desulfobulbaceae bacterium]|nr:MAG: preprotein translocase subunit SecG [Desulfobulbaceae bacterium]